MSISIHPLTEAELEATDEVIKAAYNVQDSRSAFAKILHFSHSSLTSGLYSYGTLRVFRISHVELHQLMDASERYSPMLERQTYSGAMHSQDDKE